jgi:tripartite ATP-independent transporter DctM subunit
MSGLQIGLAGFLALLALLAARIPIGVAMLAVGMVGYVSIAGLSGLLNHLKTETYWRFSNFDLSVIPLFMLMGQFAAQAGLSKSLFRAANAWMGHFRGGIAMAAIGACAGFGTISGSSIATAATMGKVALPELRRYNYSGGLATAALAAGGTLGILIPPSIVLIIYAIMVQGSVVALFQAAFIPGILAALGYIATVAIVVRVRPEAGPAGPRASDEERWKALVEIWPVLLIFAVVMGGIYVGFFTPTEGAGVGAAGTFLVAVALSGMRWSGFVEALLETAHTTALIYLILLGAAVVPGIGPAAARRAARDARPVRAARLHHGLAVDDPADGADLLADHRRARLRRAGRGPEAVVRDPGADRGRGRPHHPAGRIERLRDPFAREGRADDRDLQGRAAVPRLRRRAHRADHRVPGDRARAAGLARGVGRSGFDDKVEVSFARLRRFHHQLGPVEEIALVAFLTRKIQLGREDAATRRLHLDVEVARAARVQRRHDRLQPVAALRVGVLVPAVAEAAVVVLALLVRVPELQKRVGHGLAVF